MGANAGYPWSIAEVSEILKKHECGMPPHEIARKHNRPETEVIQKLFELKTKSAKTAKPARTGNIWIKGEFEELRKRFEEGFRVEALAKLHKRTEREIEEQLKRAGYNPYIHPIDGCKKDPTTAKDKRLLL